MTNYTFCIGNFARFIRINLPFADYNTITIFSNAIVFTLSCYPYVCPSNGWRGRDTQGTRLRHEPADDFHVASERRVVDWCQAASVHQVPRVEVVVLEYRP